MPSHPLHTPRPSWQRPVATGVIQLATPVHPDTRTHINRRCKRPVRPGHLPSRLGCCAEMELAEYNHSVPLFTQRQCAHMHVKENSVCVNCCTFSAAIITVCVHRGRFCVVTLSLGGNWFGCFAVSGVSASKTRQPQVRFSRFPLAPMYYVHLCSLSIELGISFFLVLCDALRFFPPRIPVGYQ